MPYAFAHPAAVIALPRLLGRLAVPSALVTGSVIPDAWYFAPLLTRADSHSAAGLLLFCLPAGLVVYAAFHLIFKVPLLMLLPEALAGRLRAWTSPGLPAVAWRAVVASLAAGTLTHYAWDALTHPGLLVEALPMLQAQLFTVDGYALRTYQVLQHASTVLGTAFVAWWVWRKLRGAAGTGTGPILPAAARLAIVGTMAMVSAAVFLGIMFAAVPPSEFGIGGARSLLRAAAITAVSTLGLALLAYCLAWRVTSLRFGPSRRAIRAPASTSAS